MNCDITIRLAKSGIIFASIAFAGARQLVILGGTAIAERNAFFLVVLAAAVIGGVLFQLTGMKTKQRILTEPEHGATVFRYFGTNPLLRKVLISGILGSLRSMPGVILTPPVTYYFANKNAGLTLLYTVLFGAGNFLGMLASMVLVPKLTKKHGTVKVFVGSNLLTVLPNVLIFGLDPMQMPEQPAAALLIHKLREFAVQLRERRAKLPILFFFFLRRDTAPCKQSFCGAVFLRHRAVLPHISPREDRQDARKPLNIY